MDDVCVSYRLSFFERARERDGWAEGISGSMGLTRLKDGSLYTACLGSGLVACVEF